MIQLNFMFLHCNGCHTWMGGLNHYECRWPYYKVTILIDYRNAMIHCKYYKPRIEDRMVSMEIFLLKIYALITIPSCLRHNLPPHCGLLIEDLLQHVPKTLSCIAFDTLKKDISIKELSSMLEDIANNKTPSLDGLTVEFFKTCWSFIRNDYHIMLQNDSIFGKFLYIVNFYLLQRKCKLRLH